MTNKRAAITIIERLRKNGFCRVAGGRVRA